ncbi:MAG: SET domain-containing protein-lysine N-methyltransferase [Desulfobulbaceae bacterium]|nr:SET domain-containing protein-lysine N-methyltransferase [Desulfobulbaceae bacterium]
MELLYLNTSADAAYELPVERKFVVEERELNKGKAVYTLYGHARGDLITNFTGTVLSYRTQHTLQINPTIHLLDLDFVGYLAHSCSPNVFVDMQSLEVWALQDIAPGASLTMDYAATEDILFKQFPCLCGSPSCRHWITGRKEQISEEGRRFLQGFTRC